MSSTEIDNLLIELRSNKPALKLKAFNRLNDILESRQAEVQSLLKRDPDFSWEALFRSAHQGTMDHAQKLDSSSTELLETDPKITGYSRLLLKICDSAQNGEEIETATCCIEIIF
jgi:hypothetical protein